VLYPRVTHIKASPKAISRRTSYLRVRLEFLRYPQIIPAFFNRHGFGPPLNFTSASTCSWIGHPVSGLRHITVSPYSDSVSLRLQCYSTLTLLHNVTRWPVLQKVHGRTSRASTACKHRVSGSISLPSRGSFHLSLTVLCSIGHQKVFSLGRWSSRFPTGFHVPRSTLDQSVGCHFSLTGLSPSMVGLSRPLQLRYRHHTIDCPQPQQPKSLVWAPPRSLAAT
jgi:hypothetical protein